MMKNLAISLTKVPSTLEEDLNKGFTKWVSGRLVEFNESSKYVQIFINHQDEINEDIDGKTTVTTNAFALRVKKPVTIQKIIAEAEKSAYRLYTEEEYIQFQLDLINLIQDNPEDPQILEHSKFIRWVKDGYSISKGVTVDEAKEIMSRKITEFDTSEAVNSFFLNDNPVWLDKDTRVGLMNSITIEKSVGLTNTTLWLGIQNYTLPIDLAINLLAQLEIYAKECYNKTAEHKSNLEKLTLAEEIMEYNYKEGYPEKLRINI